MNQIAYFWLFLKASLFSTGGMGNLPSLHHDLLVRRWATDGQFAESLTIGQVSPGPNGLWVVCLGYLTNGSLGALFATIAVTIPPLLVLLLERVYRDIKHHPAVAGFVRGMSLAVVGTFAVVLTGMLRTAHINSLSVAIGAIALVLGATKRVPLPLIICGAAFAGAVGYR